MSDSLNGKKKTRYFVLSQEGLASLLKVTAETALEHNQIPQEDEMFDEEELYILYRAGIIEGEILNFEKLEDVMNTDTSPSKEDLN
jgi:hypothetical protein